MSLLDAVLSGGSQLIDAGMDIWKQDKAEGMQDHSMQFNAEQADKQRVFSAGEAQKTRDWQERMANTAWQRGVADLTAAGLNPMLAYMKGGADTPGGATATGSAASSGSGNVPGLHRQPLIATMHTAQQISNLRAEEGRVNAERDRIKAEEAEIRARTPRHAVDIRAVEQSIVESTERVQKIIAEARATNQSERTSAAHQHLMEQQRSNLFEEARRLIQEVRRLEAATASEWARERHTSAEETILRTRIRERQPEIEAAIKHLEEEALKLSMPGRQVDSVTAGSFWGAWNRAIRAITGQSMQR